MKVWIDNRIDQESEVTPEAISKGFWASELGQSVSNGGGRLERYLLLYVSNIGTFDIREQQVEWDAICNRVLEEWPA